MKKNRNKKNQIYRKKTKSTRSLLPLHIYLSAHICVWLFIILLWFTLKLSLGREQITQIETSSFRFLVVYCLGMGFTVISIIDWITQKVFFR